MRSTFLFLVLAGCQLADPIDAPKCPAGFHPELQKCVADETTEKRIKIASCTFEPQVLTVKVDEEFQFENTDDVPHQVTGTEGTSWVSVEPKKLSLFMSIKKAGSWDYTASGCSAPGTVKVE